MSETNPLQQLLRREIGIDAFPLDGDATEIGEQWCDKPRAAEAA